MYFVIETPLADAQAQTMRGKGFWPRAGAYLVDLLILNALGLVSVAGVTRGLGFVIGLAAAIAPL